MKSLPLLKKQVLILFIFCALSSIFAIVHGIFFDLDFEQIQRLTIEGIIVTFIVLFPAILFLEWVFDINNRKKFDELEKRLRKIEGKRK